MATYTFKGGDFDDPNDWSPQGVPGAGDTILDAGAGITAEGETVANAKGIDGDPIVIVGGLNITDEGYDLEVQDGDYSVGSIEGAISIFSGATVTAGSVDLTLPNVALSLGDLSSDTSRLTVSGSVVADGDDIDTECTFDVEGDVSITDGYLEIDSGATTIGDQLSLTDSSVTVYGFVSGTLLKVSGDVTLSNGGSFGVYDGGKATVETLNAGETGNSTIDVEDAASTLTVVKTLTLGSNGDGVLTLANGGGLIVDGAFDMAENDGSTSTATIGDAGATLTIQGEWQIGVAGTATATITQGVTADALGGITLGVQATGNGTLTVSQASTVLSVTGDVVIGKAGAGNQCPGWRNRRRWQAT